MTNIRPALTLLVLFTLLFGGVYPLLVTGAAQGLFPRRAEGSLLLRGGAVAGSALIGQQFTRPEYFWGRPSATTPPYNAQASAASQLGPSNPALKAQVEARVQMLRAANPGNKAPIPADLAFASASGLDADISVAAAEYQVKRVASARGMEVAAVQALVKESTEKRQFGVFGQPRVNVLGLNLALDEKAR